MLLNKVGESKASLRGHSRRVCEWACLDLTESGISSHVSSLEYRLVLACVQPPTPLKQNALRVFLPVFV